MSADTAFNQNEVGHCADQVNEVGGNSTVYFEIKNFGYNSGGIAQLKIIGVSRDPDAF